MYLTSSNLRYLTLDLAREHGPDSNDVVYVVSGPLWMADSPDEKLTKEIGAKPHTKVQSYITSVWSGIMMVIDRVRSSMMVVMVSPSVML